MAGIPPLPAPTPTLGRYGSGVDFGYDPDSSSSPGGPLDNGYAPDGSYQEDVDGDVSATWPETDRSTKTPDPRIIFEFGLGDGGRRETDGGMGLIGHENPSHSTSEGMKTTETGVGTTTTVMSTTSPTVTGTSTRLSTDSVSSSSSATVPTLPTPSTSSATTAAASGVASGLLPVWAIVLIVIGAVMLLIFAVSLVVFCMKERQRRRQSGEDANYGRAVRRALAAATVVAIPLWVVRRIRRRTGEHGPVRCAGGDQNAPGEDEKQAWFEKRLQMDMERQESESREALTAPGATGFASSSASPSPPPLPAAPPQRTPSTISAISSTISGGSVNGEYVRVEINQLQEDPTLRGSDGSVDASGGGGGGLSRNASLVSALSSMPDGDRHEIHDIPLPTPISEQEAISRR